MGLERGFGDEPAFVPYLTAGDPDVEASRAYVEALERGGADAIELGLPFSEPIAEGSTIQAAIARALEAGMTPTRYFEFVESLDVDVPLVCMTYYNLVAQFEPDEPDALGGGDEPDAATERGPRAFVERASAAGIEGLIIVDLPVEEADPLRAACDEFGVDLVFIVAPTTRGERLDRMRDLVSGYVYVQARLGVTGAREDVADSTDESLARLDDWDVPRAVGFGIKTREHAARITAAGADGIIVGSALVDIVADGHEAGDPVDAVAERLEETARELKAGAVAGAQDETEASDGSDGTGVEASD